MNAFTFRDRRQAGQRLGEQLARLTLPQPRHVLALPRGGVPVGLEVARALQAPLDTLLVRKIGVPGQPELAVAAVVEGDPPETVVDNAIAHHHGVTRQYIEAQARQQSVEIARRRELYRGNRALPAVEGHAVIVVDDGIATGTTVRAALSALWHRDPACLVLAVPIAPRDVAGLLRTQVDMLVCLIEPLHLDAIATFYEDFHQVDDTEVLAALQQADRLAPQS